MQRKNTFCRSLISAVLLVITLLSSATASAATNIWTTKASVSTAKYDFQAQVVNGQIYQFGGLGANSIYYSELECYDPSTNTWTAKASMYTPRRAFQSVVIDNEIYAIGGWSAYNTYALPIEKYNTETNTWTTLASMPVGKAQFQAVVIDGKIYTIGGYNSTGRLVSVEAYDPATDTWTTKAPMTTRRTRFTAVVVNGKIYAIGGESQTAVYQSSVEEYNPATNTWTTKAPMSTPMECHGAEVVNGKIYVIGGSNSSTAFSSTQEYDPSTDTWTTKAPMPTARSFMETVLVDNKIYVIGGHLNNPATTYKTAESYDPATDTWTSLPSMVTARANFQAVFLNGRIYAISGSGNTSSVEAYSVPVSDPTLSAAVSGSQVALSWNATDCAASYNVYRSTTSGGPYEQIASGLTATNYTDSGLTAGATYYYVVTAVSSDGDQSAYSNEVSATPVSDGNAMLRITMITGQCKEYDLSASQVGAFIAWYNGSSAKSAYTINKPYNVGAMTSRSDYIVFNKIAFFEVMSYNDTPPTPSSETKTALLRVTMSTGDILEYEMTAGQISSFTTWFSGGSASTPSYAIEKEYNLGPFTARKDYLAYGMISDFEVIQN